MSSFQFQIPSNTTLEGAVREYETMDSMLKKILPFSASLFGYFAFVVFSSVTAGQYVPSWKIAAAGILCLLFLANLYGILWMYRFLPSIASPCYRLFRVKGDFDIRSASSGVDLMSHLEAIIEPKSISWSPYLGSGNARSKWEQDITFDEESRERTVLVAQYSDRLGNHIFQYVYSRLRAMLLDVHFASPSVLGTPFTTMTTLSLRWSHPSWKNHNSTSSVATHELLLRNRENESIPIPSTVDKLKLLSIIDTLRNVPVCKYTMDVRLYSGLEDIILQWTRKPIVEHCRLIESKYNLSVDTPAISKSPASSSKHSSDLREICRKVPNSTDFLVKPLLHFSGNDVAIHVRLGDILMGAHSAYRILPMSYYRRGLDRIAYEIHEQLKTVSEECHHLDLGIAKPGDLINRVVIVTESDSSPIIHRMQKEIVAYLSGTCNTSSFTNSIYLQPGTTNEPTKTQKQRSGSVWRTEKGRKVSSLETNKSILSSTISEYSLPPPPMNFALGCSTNVEVLVQSLERGEDFCTLASAPNLILSVSSFAWWAGALSARARSIIYPEFGMLLPHRWRPSPRYHPSVFIAHDISMVDLFRNSSTSSTFGYSYSSTATLVDTDGDESEAHLSIYEHEEDELLRSKKHRGPFDEKHSNYIIDKLVNRSVWASKSVEADGLPRIALRSGVDILNVSHLPRWGGNTPSSVATLFD